MTDELQRQGTIDPSTAEILEGVERKQEEAKLPRNKRRQKKKEREKAKARLPGRVNWDLPQNLKQQIISIAEKNKIPTSQVAAFLLNDGLKRLESEEIEFKSLMVPSTSPRYDWNIELPDEE